MPVTRWAISLEKSLAREIKRSAAREPISAWLADAARRKLRTQGLRQVVTAWETEHGAFTDAELQAAHQELDAQLRPRRPRARKRR
jgi:hypothetical protein